MASKKPLVGEKSCGFAQSAGKGYGQKFTAVFEQEGEWWIGYVEELPGANTQGQTLEEVRENLKEAVQLVIH